MTFRKTGDVVPMGKPLDVEEMKKKNDENTPKPVKIPEKKDSSK